MQVEIRPDQEAFLADQIRSGRFTTAEEAVHEAVSLLERVQTESPVTPRQSLGAFLKASPLAGSGLVFERIRDSPRPLAL